MVEIRLTRGMVAMIDEADLRLVESHSWRLQRTPRNFYARTDARVGGKWVALLMHRLILGLGDHQVDHKNRNGLDCRRENLRQATNSQNQANSIGHPSRRKSKYKGVSWQKDSRRMAGGYWRANITVNGKTIRRAAPTEPEAASAYNELAVRHFGAFARLNDAPASSRASW